MGTSEVCIARIKNYSGKADSLLSAPVALWLWHEQKWSLDHLLRFLRSKYDVLYGKNIISIILSVFWKKIKIFDFADPRKNSDPTLD